jgi:type II secretory pathway pseudopilin PulG
VILGLAIVGAAALATVLWQVHRARQQLRWREDTEARMAAMHERRAQANGHPHSGQVQHLGRHL